MPLLDLDAAVGEILLACEDGQRVGKGSFIFLVGAGISQPPIPLAQEIQQHCESVARRNRWVDEPRGQQPIDRYSDWFQRAYPQAARRQRYLRELIEGKPISPANFRLAHLLSEKRIANIVITPNFDDFISRALSLFGIPHIVCDHPATVDRIHPEHDDVQIVHVHGTYWYYDCCNLREEIEARAEPSLHTTSTMGFLLDRIFFDRSPIVIGYSGWEGDVITAALKRRLRNRLGHNVYWFCYRRDDADSLPKELRVHPQVFLVVPSGQGLEREVSIEPKRVEARGERQSQLTKQSEASTVSHADTDEPRLPARQVLDRFIQDLTVKTPELTKDPLRFFAGHLRTCLLQAQIRKLKGIFTP